MSIDKKRVSRRHKETMEKLEKLEKEQQERKKRREKLQEPMKDDDIDFALDKYYDNYMDGPY